MITPKKIVNMVKALLYKQYPSCHYYIQDVPPSPIRPSFNIYIYSDRSESSGRLHREETISVGIHYYHQSNGNVPEDMEPINVYSNVKEIFRRGLIKIEDRTLKIDLIRGGTKDGEVYLIIKMVYSEEIPADDQDSTTYELIREINIS